MPKRAVVFFLHPPLNGPPSGGNRYNQQVIAQAERRRYPLHPVCVPFPEATGNARCDLAPVLSHDFCLWDSLMLPLYPKVTRPARSLDAWLMHFLPSSDPCLAPAAAARARRLEDRIATSCRFFIVTGHSMGDELRRRYPTAKVWVCEPGVDDCFDRSRRHRRRSRLGSARVELLTVANLLQAKGYSELMVILRGLLQHDWRWHIVGSRAPDPDFAARFVADAGDLVKAKRIVFHDALDPRRLAELMANVDIYVSASHFESYGMALAEALATGLPVVTTDVGEAARLVHRARAGYCIPVGHWGAFAQCLVALMTDHSQRHRPCLKDGAQNRTWSQAFDCLAKALQSVQRSAGRLPLCYQPGS